MATISPAHPPLSDEASSCKLAGLMVGTFLAMLTAAFQAILTDSPLALSSPIAWLVGLVWTVVTVGTMASGGVLMVLILGRRHGYQVSDRSLVGTGLVLALTFAGTVSLTMVAL